MEDFNYDFSGWATVYNVGCTDGRTILPGAFEHADDTIVPLCYNHGHDSIDNVIGKALLHSCDEGVYMYGAFNDTKNGRKSKEAVAHGDIDSLSIYANHLREQNNNVYHGDIKEVSLVLSGANIEAKIDNVLCHDDSEGNAAIIYSGEKIEYDPETLMHSDDEEDNMSQEEYAEYAESVFDSMDDAQKTLFLAATGAVEVDNIDELIEDSEDIIDSMDEEQKELFFTAVENVENDDEDYDDEDEEDYDDEDEEEYDDEEYEDEEEYDDDDADEDEGGELGHSDFYGGACMKHNAFDNCVDENYISHAELEQFGNTLIAEAIERGSMKKAVLAHDDTDVDAFMATYPRVEHEVPGVDYGITDMNQLLPDYHEINPMPTVVKTDDEWKNVILNGAHKSPFSRIRSTMADFDEQHARAKGYIKGRYKKAEVISLLRRTTEPTTIYIKQSFDRDDVIDATVFSFIPFVKKEMESKLDKEKALAALVGDGRALTDEDKIPEDKIRPIATEAELYNIQYIVGTAAITGTSGGSNTYDKFNRPVNSKSTSNLGIVDNLIRACLKSKKMYRGSGNMVMFCSPWLISQFLIVEDRLGRKLFKDVNKVAQRLGVSKIVPVPDFIVNGDLIKRKDQKGVERPLLAVLINPSDYTIGTDVHSHRAFFEDFDIDYNKNKFLYEERFCGSMVEPFSAITIFGTKSDHSEDDIAYAPVQSDCTDENLSTVLGRQADQKYAVNDDRTGYKKNGKKSYTASTSNVVLDDDDEGTAKSYFDKANS